MTILVGRQEEAPRIEESSPARDLVACRDIVRAHFGPEFAGGGVMPDVVKRLCEELKATRKALYGPYYEGPMFTSEGTPL